MQTWYKIQIKILTRYAIYYDEIFHSIYWQTWTKAENTDYTNLVSKKNKKYSLPIDHTDSACFRCDDAYLVW